MSDTRWYEVRISGRFEDEPILVEEYVEETSPERAARAAVLRQFAAEDVKMENVTFNGRPHINFVLTGGRRDVETFVTEHRTPEEVATEIDPAKLGRGRPAHEPDEWQRQALTTWGSAGDSLREQRLHAMLGLAGETGEVADLLKKHFYKPGREAGREQVLDELADVAYYVAVNAHLWGITFNDLFAHLAAKLADGHGWKGNNG